MDLLKATLKDFGEDECGVRSAALAYYTIFALPPLLILLVRIAGMIWSQQEVQGALEGQFGSVLGPSGKAQIHEMMAHGTSGTSHLKTRPTPSVVASTSPMASSRIGRR